MGQQQLLLIVLSVIIVGIAVVVGINMFSSQSYASNADAVTNDLLHFGSVAQQSYLKPEALGGLGQNFTNLDSLAVLGLNTTNSNGSYTLLGTATSDSLTIQGTGNYSKDGMVPQITAGISPDAITIDVSEVSAGS